MNRRRQALVRFLHIPKIIQAFFALPHLRTQSFPQCIVWYYIHDNLFTEEHLSLSKNSKYTHFPNNIKNNFHKFRLLSHPGETRLPDDGKLLTLRKGSSLFFTYFRTIPVSHSCLERVRSRDLHQVEIYSRILYLGNPVWRKADHLTHKCRKSVLSF